MGEEEKRVLGGQEGEEQDGAAACGERSESPKTCVAWRWGMAPGAGGCRLPRRGPRALSRFLNVAMEISGLGKNEGDSVDSE